MGTFTPVIFFTPCCYSSQETRRCCHMTWLPVVAKMNASSRWHSYLLSLLCTTVLYIFRKYFFLLVLGTTKTDLLPEAGNWDLLLGGSHSAVRLYWRIVLGVWDSILLVRCLGAVLGHYSQHSTYPTPHSLPSWDPFRPTLSLHYWGRKDTPSKNTALPNPGK